MRAGASPRALTPLDLLSTEVPFGAVAVDTETSGLFADDGARVSTVSLAWRDLLGAWSATEGEWTNVTIKEEEYAPGHKARIVSVAWPFDQGVEGKPEDNGQERLWPDADNLGSVHWRALLEWLQHRSVERPNLVFHNAKFDLEKLRVGVRRWPGLGLDLQDGLLWDTQNVNALLWPLEPTSLKPTCARLFGQEIADEQAKVKAYLKAAKLPTGRWDLMPWDVIGSYADLDARLTLMLYMRQQVEIEQRPDWNRVYELVERRRLTTGVLYRMEHRGLPFAKDESVKAAEDVKAKAHDLAKKLPFKVNDAKRFYFEEGKLKNGTPCLGLVPYQMTEKGAPSMTAEVVARMVQDEVPHAAIFAEVKKLETAGSMWYQGYAEKVGSDGRLRTCFRQNGTRSSRFSVERVNLQAIPQDYRLSGYDALEGVPTPRALVALEVKKSMPGWALFELDLAQAELRVASLYANCSRMLQMIHNQEDLHNVTTQELFHLAEGDDQWKMYRQVGKKANFSLIFGARGRTFQGMISKETGIRLVLSESERLVTTWNLLYPEFGKAVRRHSRVVERRQAKHGHGWVAFPNGERRWFQLYEEAHKAFNQRVQGTLAQYGIDWMLETDALLRTEGLDDTPIGGAGLILTIHDSQVLLLPDNEVGERLASRCADVGRRLWQEWFPGVPGDVECKRW
jgi:DNA polymerase I-like protein with 3'-5' exonuclease and polymerase domains